jgi:hypothetical protein
MPAGRYAGCLKGDVIIHTNYADQPEIKVPVYAFVENKQASVHKRFP